jgi:hypothetical protein
MNISEQNVRSLWCGPLNLMCSRASPAVISIPCTVKLDEEKSKYACLNQENGFGSA